jgi:diguanylate cyclase (GGDEF)-like protein/PAS domain S-box-containing protein
MSVDVKTQSAISEANKVDYRFWLTFQNAAAGMALISPEGKFQGANLELQRMLGYTERQLREMTLQTVTRSDSISEEMRLMSRVASKEMASYALQKNFVRKDGTTFRAQVSSSLARDKIGRPLHFIYMAFEIPQLGRRTTGKLAESEGADRESRIFETVSDACILHSPDGVITGWNSTAEFMYGYTEEEARGRHITGLAHESRHEAWLSLLAKVAEGESITNFEMVHLNADEESVLVSLNITPLLDSEGQIIEILTVARNMTERKLLTDEVQENRHVMSQVLEGLPLALYLTDGDGVPFYANAAAYELLGPGVIPGDDKAIAYEVCVAGTDDPYPEEEMPVSRALMGEAVMVENMEVHRLGSIIPVQAWGEPVFDMSGQVIYVLVAFRETGEVKSAEGALLTVRDRFKAVCDNLSDFISIFSLKGLYLYASPICSRLLGYTPDEMIGTDVRIYIHPEDLAVISKTFSRYFAGSDESMKATYRVRRKDGTYLWMETSARPVMGTYGLKREILGVSRSLEEVPDMKASLVEERRRTQDGEGEDESLRDKLTGIKNRSAVDDYLSKKLASRRASTYPIGCLLLDIDNLKEINEQHGQDGGDEVIRRVAEVIRKACRSEDFVGRLTGDEFIVVLPNTDASGTVVVGEKLVANVRNIDWSETPIGGKVTVSVGGTCIVRYSGLTESGLIEILDSQLYEAKQAGRNRFIMNARRMATTGSDWSIAARR